MALPELLEFPVGNYTLGSIMVGEVLSKRVYVLFVGNYVQCDSTDSHKLLDFKCCTVVIRSSEFIILSLHSSA